MLNIFKKIFGVKSDFGLLNLSQKWRVVYVFGGAEFLLRSIEEHFLKPLKSFYKGDISDEQAKSICTEFALSLDFSANIPFDDYFKNTCRLDGNDYRGWLSRIILSINNDKRLTIKTDDYSQNPFEAKVQCFLTIAQILDATNDELYQELSSENSLTKVWDEMLLGFFEGVFIATKRQDKERLFGTFVNKFDSANERTKGSLKLMTSGSSPSLSIDVVEDRKAVSETNNILATHSADELYTEIKKTSAQLKGLLKSKIYPEGLPLGFPVFETMVKSWDPHCLCYSTMLMIMAQLSKDAYFAKGDVYLKLCSLTLEDMLKLEKEIAKEMNMLDKYDEDIAIKRLRSEFEVAEEAILYYIDNYSKERLPDMKLIAFLMGKIYSQEEFHAQLLNNLHVFNKLRLASFRAF